MNIGEGSGQARPCPGLHVNAQIAGNIIGWIHVLVREDATALLESLLVYPNQPCNGYARRLVREAVARILAARIKTIEVYTLNRDEGDDHPWQHLLNAPPNTTGEVTLLTTPPVHLQARADAYGPTSSESEPRADRPDSNALTRPVGVTALRSGARPPAVVTATQLRHRRQSQSWSQLFAKPRLDQSAASAGKRTVPGPPRIRTY